MQFDEVKLQPAADFHVHLRQGEMMELVTPMIREGGVDTVYVMPNLVPPITTVAQAVEYRARLQPLSPTTTFLMTLYMDASITPAVVAEAARAGIAGVKVYPAGVTTNSEAGVVDLSAFDATMAAMQEHGLVLNLHGEVPSTPPSARAYATCNGVGDDDDDGNGNGAAATVMNAEPLFLPVLTDLHARFPRLRIVLEHCTTAAAVAAVRACGPTVAGTVTAHHLYLTIDDVVADSLNFCKPVAKLPADRIALLRALADSSGRFFFGSDSAPHPPETKRPVEARKKAAAGCFTQRYAVQTVVAAAEEAVARGWIRESDLTEDVLNDFLSRRGRRFYGLEEVKTRSRITLQKKGERVKEVLESADGRTRVIPFRGGEETWSLFWTDT